MKADRRLLERELLKRTNSNINPRFDLETFLFDKQLAFVRDTNPFKVAVCSRRSGKTTACAAHLIDTAVTNRGVVCLYITLSRNNAKKLVWREIHRINREYALQGKVNHHELSILFPNGSIIYLSGAKDSSEIEKFRGLAIKLCYIDECQSFRSYIEELIDDVIAPALMDYAGDLCMIGTPGPVPAGYFHDISVKQNAWSKHEWTFWDNPHIETKSGKPHREILGRELTRRGVTSDDPSIQREWFGKWVLDSDSLLIRYSIEKCHYEELPGGKYNYILGVDLGIDDADAIAVIAWSESSPIVYLVEEMIVPGQDITALSEQIKEFSEKYQATKIIMDEGALGKKIAEEIRRRKHIPVQAADKSRKIENVAFLNDAINTGRFKAKKGSRFAQDSYLLEIDREKTTADRLVVKSSYHSDIIDAVLYAFKESPAFAYQPPPIKHQHGSKEWAEAEVTDMERAAEEHFTNQEEQTKWGTW